ncbi:MAG: AtpZ/AtpI family protein [Sphingosinicella sp.]|nr:AtpZ/AtpI family protein [Sphingosinicella sp.]
MTENEPGQNPKLPEDARLTSLDERLKRARLEEAVRTGGSRPASSKGQSQGMRILSVLFGYPMGSALIGWLFDQWLGTRWVLVAMLFLGFVIAFREVWKISKERPE